MSMNAVAANKALLIGINKYHHVNSLRGCHNDVLNIRDILISKFGFSEDNICILKDQDAVKEKIKTKMEWLLDNSRPNNYSVFFFAGHGSYIDDKNGDEPDKFDELICLYDMDFNNPGSYLLDDEINQWTSKVPEGLNLVYIVDSCHSGNITRVPHQTYLKPRRILPPKDIRDKFKDVKTPKVIRFLQRQAESDMKYILLAGCQDDQTSADAFIDGKYNGAFTYFLCKTIREKGGEQTYQDLITNARQLLKIARYDQVPQCEGSNINRKMFL